MFSSLQGEYSGFVYSYAVEEPLSVGHKRAGYLPSLFWGFITLGRLISIPVSYRMKPATMVFINVVWPNLIHLANNKLCDFFVFFVYLWYISRMYLNTSGGHHVWGCWGQINILSLQGLTWTIGLMWKLRISNKAIFL